MVDIALEGNSMKRDSDDIFNKALDLKHMKNKCVSSCETWRCEGIGMKRKIDGMFDSAVESNCMKEGSHDMFDTALEVQ